MKKSIKCFLICVVFVLSSYTVYADRKSELEALGTQAQSEIERLNKEVSNAEASKTPYIEKKKEIDAKLNAANTKLSKLVNQVNALVSEIDAKEADILWLDGEESKAKELFKERMRALYEDNKLSYLDILFDSGSISDFFYRLSIINQLAEYDREIISSIINSKEIITESKKQLEVEKVEVEKLKNDAQLARDEVQALENENQQILDAINSDIASIKADIKAKEKEAERIQNQIRALLTQESGGLTYSGKGMVWPAPGYKTLTSYFGNRFHPVLQSWRSHNGIDIAAPSGANIIAAASGTVITSEYSSSYGNYIVINHGSGVTTLYAHMSSRGVSVGANVAAGQSIGKVGSTGISTGPHLHFEVSVNGSRQDPLSYVN